ncbi:hypothetical protein RHMOL_Rhmol08G0122500 [Rhododendron molle]|uniref:Uncharacterized protein n=1 Tax=Rhododendron molle TaxID=49168 RepID=A0ACC0MPK9_RHOML|nr:hypothetical protein RHMOL_Rhmol08G0122500 [Rhododendron molle]
MERSTELTLSICAWFVFFPFFLDIGKGKPIEESDIPQLPYLQAIVKETMRIHPPAPLLVPRTVETDVEVYGYTIPQGAQVLVNAWAIGHDPSVRANPTSFMPERFLDSEINIRGRDFELIPFGAGRRICPGLSLAIRVVPLMLGSLINSFVGSLKVELSQRSWTWMTSLALLYKRLSPSV